MKLSNMLYLAAAVQWGILAPLNLVKVLLNKVSPTAHLWVPKHSEVCQGQCGIARMWATLFWGSQIAFSAGYLYIYLANGKGKLPFALIGALQKLCVSALLIKAFLDGVVREPIGAAGALDLLMALLILLDLRSSTSTTSTTSTTKRATKAKATSKPWYSGLVAFASSWWYPWLVGALSGANTFAIVLSGPLVVLYISGVFARPSRFFVTAVANAVGTALGVAGLIYLIHLRGTDQIKADFPTIFASQTWDRTEYYMQQYGVFGVVLVSAMPIVLHPLVLLAMMVPMADATIVACVLAGRVLKYTVMAQLALTGSAALKFFGSAAVKAADDAKATKKAN